MQDKSALQCNIQSYLKQKGIEVLLSLPPNKKPNRFFVNKNLPREEIYSKIMKKRVSPSDGYLHLEIDDPNNDEFVIYYIFSNQQLL